MNKQVESFLITFNALKVRKVRINLEPTTIKIGEMNIHNDKIYKPKQKGGIHIYKLIHIYKPK